MTLARARAMRIAAWASLVILLAACTRGAPVLRVSPGSLDVSARVGERISRTLTILNDGTAPGTVTLSSSADWIEVTPASVSVAPGQTVDVSVDVFCGVQGETVGDLSARSGSASVALPVYRACEGLTAYLYGDVDEASGAADTLSIPTPGPGIDFTISAPPGASWLTASPLVGTSGSGDLRLDVDAAACTSSGVLDARLDVSFVDGTAFAAHVFRICADARHDLGYDIDLRFSGDGFTVAALEAFVGAAARWEQIIVDDLVDYSGSISSCLGVAPDPSTASIDDLLIAARVTSIDGLSGIVGRAGPCDLRGSGPDVDLPVYGVMEFDVDDVDWLLGAGLFGDTILHEMGHVLGIGTLWTTIDPGLLVYETDPPGGSCAFASAFTTPPVFTGSEAVAAYGAFGSGDVPVEDLYGAGTQCAHWRESIFDSELMTGILDTAPSPLPLSRVTAGSLVDLGYVVNADASDDFPPPAPAGGKATDTGFEIALHEILHTPFGELGPPRLTNPASP